MLLNNNQLVYIASGLGYTRLTLADLDDKPEKREIIQKIFSKLNGDTDHHFGYLFNAWTEAKFGPRLEEYRPYVSETHCDSGGLQVITRGMQITPALRTEIYNTQSKYCDLAMCFDEIPVTTVGIASGRNDVTNRFFNVDSFEECARTTGKNLFEQIKVFEANQSKAKPLLIVQGNCSETYQQWTKFVLDEIPPEYHSSIGGVAMGGAALGTGSLEDIIRAFMVTQLPFEVKHLHILGIGSAIRLTPFLVFMQNGLYKDMRISYDSTTHTSGMVFGRFYSESGWLKFPNKYEDPVIHKQLYKEVVQQFDLGISYESFLDVLKNANGKYASETGNCKSDVVLIMTAFAAASIMNFMKHIDKLSQSRDNLLQYVGQYENPAIFNSLYNVKTLEDFRYWESFAGRRISSSRIAKQAPQTLDDFF